jgi:biopolymer transport protein ExbB/TolQ
MSPPADAVAQASLAFGVLSVLGLLSLLVSGLDWLQHRRQLKELRRQQDRLLDMVEKKEGERRDAAREAAEKKTQLAAAEAARKTAEEEAKRLREAKEKAEEQTERLRAAKEKAEEETERLRAALREVGDAAYAAANGAA